jgi:NAD(P)-dependent dehydrogenase (short-subunit alcohol dehydrogenase family)
MSDASRKAMALDEHRPNARLSGRRIVITGAASGIGWRTSEVFAAEGAKLSLFDSSAEGLREIARRTRGAPFTVDVTDEAAVMRAAETAASRMGGIDGIVNAAGIVVRGPVGEVTAETYRRVLDVNLMGPYIVVRSCLKWLLESSSATIVNIASGQGLLPNSPEMTAYAASKGGVVTLTRALAAELAPTVRVNSVCPGMVNTPMTNGVQGDITPYAMKRVADPLEIAQVILFLTGSESSFMTGAAIAVDGGRTFH